MIKVLIVDDHNSMCDSLTFALESAGDYSVVGRLPNAEYADIYCQRLMPDLIFMDVCTFEGASGLDATVLIRREFADIKVIIMSGFDEISFQSKAREAGAHAFVSKNRSLIHFVEVAGKVMQGVNFWSESKSAFPTISEDEGNYTNAELEVLRLVCKHRTDIEIADELGIDAAAVKQLKSGMLEKSGFDNIVDMAFNVISKCNNDSWI
jgi:DNA-binding NarL/FixJ family response regulator